MKRFTIHAVADVAQLVEESDEGNNTTQEPNGERYTDSPSLVLPDPGTTNALLPVTTTIDSLADLVVTVDVNHTWVSDLIVTLISPTGTRIILVNRRGGSGDNFSTTAFDDSAVTPIGGGSAPFNGSSRPEEALSTLVGEDPNGTWQLEIQDVIAPDWGILNTWSIEIW